MSMPCSIRRAIGSGPVIDATASSASGNSYAPAEQTARAPPAALRLFVSTTRRRSVPITIGSVASQRASAATGTGAPSKPTLLHISHPLDTSPDTAVVLPRLWPPRAFFVHGLLLQHDIRTTTALIGWAAPHSPFSSCLSDNNCIMHGIWWRI